MTLVCKLFFLYLNLQWEAEFVWGSVHFSFMESNRQSSCISVARWLMVLKTTMWTLNRLRFLKQASVSSNRSKSSSRSLSSNFHLSTGRRGPPVRPRREAFFYNPKWAGEKDQITSEATPAAHKEVLRWTMELPWAPPLSPSWGAQPELNQSLGSEQPHGWTKCSQYNLIVIVLPSNVKSISFQNHKGMGL